MIAISVKDLRLKMPLVRSELKKGTRFLLIHKSKPIGKIYPIEDIDANPGPIISPDEEFKEWEQAAIMDLEKHVPYLTQEEVDYYMALPNIDDV